MALDPSGSLKESDEHEVMPSVDAAASATNAEAAPAAEGGDDSGDRGPPLRRRRFRGGFSTSICELFHDPQRRTDCCAVACCGVLSSDRTRYLLTGERPPRLWRRIILYFLVPLAFIFALDYIYDDDSADLDKDQRDAADLVVTVVFVLYLVFLCSWGHNKRAAVRRELMGRLYTLEQEAVGVEDAGDEAMLRSYLNQHAFDARSPHRLCGCYSDDAEYSAADDVAQGEEVRGDLCSCMWRFASRMCCGWCCGCWIQCCGMCAIGQEEREMLRLVSKRQRLIDYVTFQPYSDYFPRLEELRSEKNSNVILHFRALSELSKNLLKALGIVLLVLLLFALTAIADNFSYENLLVLLLTFLQVRISRLVLLARPLLFVVLLHPVPMKPFLSHLLHCAKAFFVLYLVHWAWCKYDLSLDAVVKYFATGFLLTTPLALVFEMLVAFLLNVFMIVVFIGVLASDEDLVKKFEDDPVAAGKEMARRYPGIFVLYIFLNSFVIAALVEETVKYFGYWMLPHPDLLAQEDLSVPGSSSVGIEEGGDLRLHLSGSGEQDEVPDQENTVSRRQRKSLNSRGAGVTVAMVAVALGFACAENLMYIFVYSPASFGIEMSTLLLRSLFPVHPLAAAIQSIGVCQRDIEGNKHIGLGRIMLPAIVLHGLFDFVLMILAFINALDTMDNEDDDDKQKSDVPLSEQLLEELPGLACGIAIVLVGSIYYACLSRAQKRRLDVLESAAADSDALLLV